MMYIKIWNENEVKEQASARSYQSLTQMVSQDIVIMSSVKMLIVNSAKSAVEGLRTVEVNSTDIEICAVCKDSVFNNEGKIAKQLECGHIYHGDCIVPWLNLKNSCPVCRFELPTDDPEYEEDRKKRSITVTAAADDHGCSSSSGAAD
ncbi:hypothetical protein L1987_23642 [Smallanthus sonchifolius]|uniref:Uncharacterized protein n=2 Tax=Smallanthus sonchifolius TaxID=185202 RepID=A0ACB9IJK2_9ASTR|nr:hypothetical protein L1987_23639 [Smallanthus sonchifolius]KAI3807708.1 hypothetical protein L1987_23642 [Smallanthus sonchifolius]